MYVVKSVNGIRITKKCLLLLLFQMIREKIKVLNLTISEALINGIYNKSSKSDDREKLQNDKLQLFLLAIETLFSIDSEMNREGKYKYLVSQVLMKVISTIGIDGVAYLSMKGKDGFQYPFGVNLAIPAFDISEKKQYSKFREIFNIFEPVKFNNQMIESGRSYVSTVYNRKDRYNSSVYVDGVLKYYGDTAYSKRMLSVWQRCILWK